MSVDQHGSEAARFAVQELWRFPIKSFQGERVERSEIVASGVLHDRRFALRERASGKILSAKHPRLGGRILELPAKLGEVGAVGDAVRVLVGVGGRWISNESVRQLDEACSDYLGSEVNLVSATSLDRGVHESDWPELPGFPLSGKQIEFELPLLASGSFADLEPLHLITTASLRELSAQAHVSDIASVRFRPSVVLDAPGTEGFVENDWGGRVARLGTARLQLGRPAPRCIVVTRAQASLPKDPRVLAALVRLNRQPFGGMELPSLGIYARVLSPGTIELGDQLRWE